MLLTSIFGNVPGSLCVTSDGELKASLAKERCCDQEHRSREPVLEERHTHTGDCHYCVRLNRGYDATPRRDSQPEVSPPIAMNAIATLPDLSLAPVLPARADSPPPLLLSPVDAPVVMLC